MQFLNAFLLLLTLCATIVYKTHGTVGMLYGASVAVLIFLALTWKKISPAGKIFILINIAMLVVFWGRGVDLALVEHGLGRITLFAAFMVGLIFLRVAAKKSRIISRCGSFLINQKPGARYAVLSYGSCLLGAILSFGALNLMGQVIANGQYIGSSQRGRTHLCHSVTPDGVGHVTGFCNTAVVIPFFDFYGVGSIRYSLIALAITHSFNNRVCCRFDCSWLVDGFLGLS